MDVVARAKNLITNPNQEWRVIAAEPADVQGLFTGYAMILAAIPAIAGFIGLSLIGSMLGLGRIGVFGAFLNMVVSYVLGLVGVFVLAKVIQFLAPRFDAPEDELAAMKLAVYAPTAAWVAGVFLVLPLSVFGLIAALGGLYSLYLFYVGVPIVTRVPQERTVLFILAVIVCAIVINLIVGLIAGLFLRY